MELSGFIYGLKNPIDGDFFYVGKTIKELPKRLAQHISDSGFLYSPKDKIISDIINANKTPLIVCLEQVKLTPNETFDSRLLEAEKKWIQTISESYSIVNVVNNNKHRKIRDISKSRQELQELVSKIDTPVYKIELEVGMPATSLQKALKGQRTLAKKWVIALKNYVNTKQYVLSATIPHIPPSKREIIGQVLKVDRPKNLQELKLMCPPELSPLERAEWVSTERQKYGI